MLPSFYKLYVTTFAYILSMLICIRLILLDFHIYERHQFLRKMQLFPLICLMLLDFCLWPFFMHVCELWCVVVMLYVLFDYWILLMYRKLMIWNLSILMVLKGLVLLHNLLNVDKFTFPLPRDWWFWIFAWLWNVYDTKNCPNDTQNLLTLSFDVWKISWYRIFWYSWFAKFICHILKVWFFSHYETHIIIFCGVRFANAQDFFVSFAQI
jgi:hypothetical protein